MRLPVTIVLSLIITSLHSCAENYATIDPTNFNRKISKRDDIETPQELIKIFYNYPENETEPTVEISSVREEENYIITLVHIAIPDDSVCSERYVLRAQRHNKTWIVSDIRHSWRCCEGRGTDGEWRSMPCP